jgi:hypothetical protein
VLLLGCTFLQADTHSDVLHVFGSMSNALTNSDAALFMEAFDRNMPDYERIKSEVGGLIQQGQITCSVQATRDDGDSKHRSVDVDWYLEIHGSDPAAPVLRRRSLIHCRLEKLNKHWRIVALDPVSFFSPQNITTQ